MRTIMNGLESSDKQLTCATRNSGAGAAGSTEKTTVWNKMWDKVRNKGNRRLKLFLDGFCAAVLLSLVVLVTGVYAQANIAPTATASIDFQVLNSGDDGFLDGFGTDPDGDDTALTYAWTRIDSSSTVVSLRNTEIRGLVRFTAPEVEPGEGYYNLIFQFIVTDPGGCPALPSSRSSRSYLYSSTVPPWPMQEWTGLRSRALRSPLTVAAAATAKMMLQP